MTTSGTYSFQPSNGELVLYAFNNIQIRSTSILQEHMQSAKMAMNMMLANWANRGVNLWKVELIQVALVQGQTSYTVPTNVVVILDAYLTTIDGSGNPIDRIILPISRTEYASYPNKEQQGFSTVFWFDRLISGSVTLWPVPDGVSANYLNYYAVTQIEDAYVTGGQTADVPYLWLEAFADGLAYRLAKIWNPPVAPALKAVADESYAIAATQNVETEDIFISPQLSSYFRP